VGKNYDGAIYDGRFQDYDADLGFWREQAQRFGDPILELAFGTGRVGLALAREGYSIFGLELRETMLKRARKRVEEENLDINLVQGDMRGFNLGKKFPLIILPFNSLAHLLSYEDLGKMLQSVAAHLAPRGRFVFDYLNPSLKILSRDPEDWYPSAEYTDDQGQKVVVKEKTCYDSASQINRVTLHYSCDDGQEFEDDILMRMYYPQELKALLDCSGWEIEDRLGDFSGSKFSSESPKQIVFCFPR